MFKKDTGVQKVQCVILTDGEANHLPKHKLVERHWEDKPYLGCNSINPVKDHLRNRKNGRTYRIKHAWNCLLYTSPSPRDRTRSRMPSSA